MAHSRRGAAAAWLGLGAILVASAAGAWRQFPLFLGDQGWYLQVAWRVSRGDILYRDVAWAYGPLPAVALAAAFRWLGPDAGWATLINAALAAAAIGLTYRAVRAVLAPAPALAFTAVAAVAGSYVSGDLIGQSLYAYTQAIPWGTAASLAALAAALAWTRRPQSPWPLALAGAAAALALLSKPEPALAALGACAVVLLAARARPAAWLTWLAAFGLAAGGALAWLADAAGWHAVWRGYTGYDQLALGGLWGLPGAQTSPRWLLSLTAGWAAVPILLATRGGPRRRAAGRAAAALIAAAGLAAIVPDLFGLEGRQMLAVVRTGAWAGLRVHPEVALQWLAAAPWSGLTWALLWAGWRGRRAQLAAAWWGLWAFALLSNLRFTATGYASPAAVAPALAVLWRLWRAVAPAASGRVAGAAGDSSGRRRAGRANLSF